MSKVQGQESLIFEKYVTFSINFPNIYDDYLQANVMIHFSCYFGKQRLIVLPGAYAFLTSSVHVPLDTVFNQR